MKKLIRLIKFLRKNLKANSQKVVPTKKISKKLKTLVFSFFDNLSFLVG